MASKGRMDKQRGSAPVGLISFLAGIAMIVFAFYLAYQIFLVPPSVRMDAIPGKPINIGQATESFTGTFFKLIFLVVMAGFGSMVANRGIKLYASNSSKKPGKKDKSKTVSAPEEKTNP